VEGEGRSLYFANKEEGVGLMIEGRREGVKDGDAGYEEMRVRWMMRWMMRMSLSLWQ